MSNLKIYPLDLTGNNPSNKITGEIVTVAKGSDRIFIPYGGPYFTKSLKIWSGSRLLRKDVDYKCVSLNRDGSLQSGKEVCNEIHILNRATTLVLEYQVIGGEYVNLNKELIKAIKNTAINPDNVIRYEQILNKPKTFPPSEHTHSMSDWKGYEHAIEIVRDIRRLVPLHKKMINDFIKSYLNYRINGEITRYFSIPGNDIFYVDDTPTANNFTILKGTGKSDNKLRIDYDELYKDLDIRYFQNSINPISRVGEISNNKTLPIVKVSNSFKVKLNKNIPVQLGGVKSQLTSGEYDINNAKYSNITNPRNKKILVYVTLELGIPKLWFSETSIAESTYDIYIGYLETNATEITTLSLGTVSRLDIFRPSEVPIGSAISISKGSPDSELYLEWDTGPKKAKPKPVSTTPTTTPITSTPQPSPPTPTPVAKCTLTGLSGVDVRTTARIVIKPNETYEFMIQAAGGAGGVSSDRNVVIPDNKTFIYIADNTPECGNINIPLVAVEAGSNGLEEYSGTRPTTTYLSNPDNNTFSLASERLNTDINYRNVCKIRFSESLIGLNYPPNIILIGLSNQASSTRTPNPHNGMEGSGGSINGSRKYGQSGAFAKFTITNTHNTNITIGIIPSKPGLNPEFSNPTDIRHGRIGYERYSKL